MEISKEEYMKILDYILENYNEIIDEYNFTNDFLIQIRNYVKDKRLDDSFMTETHKKLLINHFINSNLSFNEDTPCIITSNQKCIDVAINNDINSINYIYNIEDKNEGYEKYIIEKVLNSNYILSNNSPLFIKSNYQIAYNSILRDCKSCDYVDYNYIEDNIESIKELILKSNYTLNESSPTFLTHDKDITIHSIKINVNSYDYSDVQLNKDLDILYLLIEKRYSFILEQLRSIPLEYLKDYKVLSKCLEATSLFKYQSNSYIELLSKIYASCIKNNPTISNFESIFEYLSEKEWELHKYKNMNNYTEIHTKIISMINSHENYQDFLKEFNSLGNKMSQILEHKYTYLMTIIKEYHNLIHNKNNKNDSIELRNTIVKLSALYISKSKELYKSRKKKVYYKIIENYFKPRIDNEIIKNKVEQFAKKSIFRDKYDDEDTEIMNFTNSLKNKYISLYGSWIEKPINNFLRLNYKELSKTLIKPYNYDLYLKYLEAKKLVNRLNNEYINYKDQELTNYRDIIKYDNKLNRYILNLHIDDIEQCIEYQEKEIIYQKFLKEIMIYINNIEVDTKKYNGYIYQLAEEFPFKDEFFEFDEDCLKYHFFNHLQSNCISNYKSIIPKIILDKRYNSIIKEILIKNNIIWLWLLDNNSDLINDLLRSYKIDINHLIDIFNRIDKIVEINKYLNLDIYNIEYLKLLYNLLKCSNLSDIFVLGPDIISSLVKKTSYTKHYTKEEIIHVAAQLALNMTKKEKSTIPYIKGKHNEYNYQTYDSFDEELLRSGNDTDSCLTPCGNDNDFLHYVALDENGFAIKITNSEGKFIGRAAGIRNGNIIFLNQLRTIYDKTISGHRGKCFSEEKEIIDTLIDACNNIIEISQNNPQEKVKIDYIFITQSFLLESLEVDDDLSYNAKNRIGKYPIDINTSDWKKFITNNNLLYADEYFCFDTDYNSYDLISIASSNKYDKLTIKLEEVEAVYERKRNKIIVTNNIDFEIIRKLNKLRALDSYFNKLEFKPIEIEQDSLVIIGDNWYIIYNNEIIDSCLLDHDKKAVKEFNEIKNLLKQNNKEKIYHLIK